MWGGSLCERVGSEVSTQCDHPQKLAEGGMRKQAGGRGGAGRQRPICSNHSPAAHRSARLSVSCLCASTIAHLKKNKKKTLVVHSSLASSLHLFFSYTF